jgi:hypothetical protein
VAWKKWEKRLSVFILSGVLSGCTYFMEKSAVQEFRMDSPTGICRIDNIRAINGNGVIVTGMYKYDNASLRHLTAYKEQTAGLERLDLTCLPCEPDGPPFLIVHVKDYRITKVESPVYEIDNPVKLAYIRKALEIEADRVRLMADNRPPEGGKEPKYSIP